MHLIKRLTNWIENGDLIPALILVSVPHYATVLSHYDFALVAAAIGLLVDISHYRTIKLYMNSKGAAWMIVLTAFSVGFHIAFYSLAGAGIWSLVLGATPPAVIFSLAFISRAERLGVKSARQVATSDATVTRQETTPATVIEKDAFLTLWSANGHKSVAGLARQHGVNPRTAQRWIEKTGALGDR
jgi:hypothetical protein